MGIVAIQQCDCGYYLRTDELDECAGDTGNCVFECPACGREWKVEWLVCWERTETEDDMMDGEED